MRNCSAPNPSIHNGRENFTPSISDVGLIIMRVAMLIGLLTVCVEAAAADCTLTDRKRVSQELLRLTSWQRIHTSYKQYTPQCDDGFMAVGYSKAVVKTLATRWKALGELDRLSHDDPPFGAFVLKHIDATAGLAHVRRVLTNAQRRCPNGKTRLCVSIARSAKDALKNK